MTGILWLTQESPNPIRGGGALRQTGLLIELSRRFEIDLVVAGDPPAAEVARAMRHVVVTAAHGPGSRIRRARSLLSPVDRSFVPEVYGARSARHAILRELAARPHLAQVSATVVTHLPLAPLLDVVPGIPVFHPFHVVSEQLRGEATRSGAARGLRLRRYASNAARLERWAVRRAAATIAVSEEDAAALSEGAKACVRVVPNAVDLDVSASVGPRPREPVVLFPASLDYAPNVDGARWLVESIWPLVRRVLPGAQLLLVGRSPAAEIRALDGRDGVEVHADVPDMADWLRRARVVVVPLRFGTGTRIKALEAMAADRPVVGTTVGLCGLGITDGTHAYIADHAPALASRLVDAIGPSGDSLVSAARELVEASHTWPVVGARLADLLQDLCDGER